jgi:hypothetical protein
MSKEAQSASPTASHDEVPWKQRPLTPMKVGTQVSGNSATQLYRHAAQGRIELRKLGGRTLIVTKTLIALIESAEPWTPSDRGKAARARRSELSRERWRA